MNRQPRATDVVNFVMKNGEIRPLLVVRAWDLTASVAATLPAVAPRPGEQVKFPGHNQPALIPVVHICGVLTVDPSVDAGNVPGLGPAPVLLSKPWPANRADIEARIARGKAPNATAADITAGTEAAKELQIAGPGPTAAAPAVGGIDFRNRTAAADPHTPAGGLDYRDPAVVGRKRVLFDPDEFQVWIDTAGYDDQAKVPGTWHWPKG